MQRFDWLMGGAAIAVGLAIAASAIINATWLMELRRPKWLREQVGLLPARGILTGIGLICVVIGVVILSGWRPPWAK
jgi:hypothetical protein